MKNVLKRSTDDITFYWNFASSYECFREAHVIFFSESTHSVTREYARLAVWGNYLLRFENELSHLKGSNLIVVLRTLSHLHVSNVSIRQDKELPT